jgi:hypothetical protein
LAYRDVPAGVEQIRPIRRAVSDWAARAGPERELVEMAVDAAMTLAVTTPETEPGGGRFSVRAGRTVDDHMVVIVTSHAHWRQSCRPGAAERWSALVAERCAPGAEVRHTPEGTSIRLCWSAPGEA